MIGCAHPSIATIEAAACAEFGIRLDDMRSDRRGHGIAQARMAAMFMARERTPYSLPHIGRCFDRDHTTVMHAVARVALLAAADPEFAAKVAGLRERLC